MGVFRVPVTLSWAGAPGGPGANVWHIRTATSFPGPGVLDTDLENALTRLRSFYSVRLPDFGHATTITVGDGITEISDPQNPKYYEYAPTPMTSTVTSGMPTFLAICLSWRTTLARRAGMGRTFYGPLITGVANTDDGTPTDTFINDLKAHAQSLVTDSTAAQGWAIGVYGKQNPGDALSPRVLRDITGVKVADRWAYLSSRRD